MGFELLLLALAAASLAASWGPGNHLEFAERVYRRRKECLPRATAALLGEERQAWLYGNIAADIIHFKGYGGPYGHCHRWGIVADMRALATSPREEAFVLGYLAHLAADTVAHNHFVPYHLARYARGRQLGHVYWEMNADRFVPRERWLAVRALKSDRRLDELDRLVNATVPKRALSMWTNKLLFNHVLLVHERDHWRAGMARLHPLRYVRLDGRFLEAFRKAAVARVELVLATGRPEALTHLDASGIQAQREALATRRRLLRSHPLDADARAQLAERRAARFLVGMSTPGGAPAC